MIRYTRPAPDPDFGTPKASSIAAAESAVSAAVTAGQKPQFPELWRASLKYARTLFSAQHSKCGFCEVKLTQIPHVEHFAPKGSITELVAEGEEVAGLPNVRGRKFRVVADTGYWWLAYDWDNYSMACERCNSAWKKSLFPVSPARSAPPTKNDGTAPLLLDPFGAEDPTDHLRFDEFGKVHALTDQGRATIETVGLHRPSLIDSRLEKSRSVSSHLARVSDPASLDSQLHLTEVAFAGAASFAHAGIARSMIRQHLDMRWDDFRDLVLQFGS